MPWEVSYIGGAGLLSFALSYQFGFIGVGMIAGLLMICGGLAGFIIKHSK